MSDRIFIERFFSVEDVGIYSVGYKIGELSRFISTSILMAYNPFFYKHANSDNQSNAKALLYRTNNNIVLFLLAIAFLIAIFAKDIMNMFFSEKYFEAYEIIPIIAAGFFFMQMISLQNLAFYQSKKTRMLMLITIIVASINIASNFLFILYLGIYGAAISTLLCQFIWFLLVYIGAKRSYFIPYNFKIIVPAFLTGIALAFFVIAFVEANMISLSIKLLFLILPLVYAIRNKNVVLKKIGLK